VTKAVFFDFDGTLADTAPDLAAALNQLRGARGLAPLAVADVRPYASMGARGMLRIAFGLVPHDPEYASLRDAFLDNYSERVCVETRLFPGMAELLRELEARGIAWGIVTNKALRFTECIVATLGLRPACTSCGDSTPHLKPHPASLLLAADKLNLPAQACIYVGDDLRDVQAARAARMRAVAVEWGYHNPDNEGPRTWSADAVIATPLQLLEHL
jgi:N-acetyl-D-muramate 6-phosphate phosphatase